MHPLINIAINAARTAGNTILRALEQIDTVKVFEKNPNEFFTDIDQRAEQQIIGIIHKAYPHHGILAEESGETQLDNRDEIIWVIDPIDGTNNFIHGFPHFCVSIGIMHKQQMMHGVIYDPVRHDLFTATRGDGARCNDRRLRVSVRKQLSNALISSGLCPQQSENIAHYIEGFRILSLQNVHLRRTGSAALDLAHVAAGRLDGFWQQGLKPWDIAAGILLVKEAGGLISDFSGEENYLESGNIIAANPKLFKVMLQVLQPAFRQVNMKNF